MEKIDAFPSKMSGKTTFGRSYKDGVQMSKTGACCTVLFGITAIAVFLNFAILVYYNVNPTLQTGNQGSVGTEQVKVGEDFVLAFGIRSFREGGIKLDDSMITVVARKSVSNWNKTLGSWVSEPKRHFGARLCTAEDFQAVGPGYFEHYNSDANGNLYCFNVKFHSLFNY